MKDKKQKGETDSEVLLGYANRIIATLREPFLVLDKNLRVISVNQAFYTTFEVAEKDTIGRPLPDLGDRQWNIPKLLQLLKEIIPEKKVVKDYEVEHKFEQIGQRAMVLNACQLRVPKKIAGIITTGIEGIGGGGEEEELILLAIEDITERKHLQEELKASEERYRRAFETSRDGLLLIHKTEGNILNSNASVQELLGYSQEEFLKKKLWGIGVTKDDKDFQGMVSRLTVDGVIHYEDIPVKTKQGLSINTDVFLVDKAKVIQCNIRDITERKRVEDELKQAKEQQYKALIENLSGKVFLKDRNSVYISCNENYVRDLKIKADEIKGKTDYDFYPKELAEKYRADDKRAMESGKTEDIEEKYIQDGQERFIHTIKIPVRDGQGNVIGILGIFWDITEVKLEEEALRESESRYRLLAHNATDIIWTSDMFLSFTYFSPSVMHILGYTPEEMLTKRIEDFLTPDSIQLAQRVLLEEIAKESLPGTDLSRSRMLELQHIRKDGAIIWVEIRMSFLRDQAHRPMGILGITRDVSERKRQEEQIRHAAGEWRMTFDSITDLVSIIDREFRLVRVNKAFAHAFGMNPKEVVGKTCYELVREAGESWFSYPHKKTVETKKPNTVEFFEPHLKIYLEVSISPIFDDKGEVVATVHTAKDITMRKEMEKDQRLTQLGKLVADMAHEVNNPLMIISGNAQLSLMENIQNEIVNNNLKIIFEETKRAKDIIQRLLKFSRPSRGELQATDINKNIEAVLSIVEHQFNLANIKIKRNYSDNLPLILIDEHQIQEVFMNLLNNANDAMPESGVIEVTTSLKGDFLRIDFKDTGCGMPEEAMKRLFEPFFTTKEKGTGLGLSVCYGIIKVHNGELRFESKLGKGTTATILLPLQGEGNSNV